MCFCFTEGSYCKRFGVVVTVENGGMLCIESIREAHSPCKRMHCKWIFQSLFNVSAANAIRNDIIRQNSNVDHSLITQLKCVYQYVKWGISSFGTKNFSALVMNIKLGKYGYSGNFPHLGCHSIHFICFFSSSRLFFSHFNKLPALQRNVWHFENVLRRNYYVFNRLYEFQRLTKLYNNCT